MSDKPAVLLSEDLVSLLGEKAICKASYEELTGTKYPWEIDHNKIQKIRKKIEHIEVSIRAANPSVDITCIVAGEGAFWLNSEGLAEFTDKMKNKTIAARPNVILEMGYFMGKIGRENIIVLKQKEVSHYPSDIQGIVYKEYTKGPGEWRNQIILELKSMGF